MKLTFFGKKKQAEDKQPVRKSALREWMDAIVFAVVAATIIRWLLIEAFTIPTPSMEKSLLVGDFLFVSKMHYGARTPKTPLQIPLTHQKIWLTDIPSYLTWIQLPQFRLPGFTSVKNNDVVVFNYPTEMEYPVDLKTNYIKRCIGIPGDSLLIVDQVVYINGKELTAPPDKQQSYIVTSTEIVKDRVFKNLDITDVVSTQNGKVYFVQTNPEKAEKLKKFDFIVDVKPAKFEKGDDADRIFPYDKQYDWSLDNFGPLYMPKKGDKIVINALSLPLYQDAIVKYEGNKDAKVENGQLLIDGNVVTEYTFKQNYYFMMGDNRHNSQDSRVWGFVPEDHILGKGLLIWWSVNPDGDMGSIFTRIRWGRIFKIIK
jgi:signal peptidase I